jgi:serine/threonine-protein kinase
MANVLLDDEGRLWQLKVTPPQYDESEDPAPAPDWSLLFKAAELDIASFSETPPRWLSEHYCDSRAAWEGTYPGQPEREIRVEACAYRGLPVYFEIIHPWQIPHGMVGYPQTADRKAQAVLYYLLMIVVLAAGILLARRNLRLGRGDRRGAVRLAYFVFLMAMISWLFRASHVWSLKWEIALLFRQVGSALFDAGMVWLMYIALEPFVRRRWPEALISWNRVLAGRFRDPLVGRHILFGAAIGIGIALWFGLMHFAPELLDLPRAQPPPKPGLGDLRGASWIIGDLFQNLREVIYIPMILMILLVLGRIAIRRQWLAVAVMAAIMAGLNSVGTDYPWLYFVVWLAVFATAMTCAVRFGIFALVVGNFYGSRMTSHVLTLDFPAWYVGGSLVILSLAAALAIYGFYISLAGRPLFKGDAVDGA